MWVCCRHSDDDKTMGRDDHDDDDNRDGWRGDRQQWQLVVKSDLAGEISSVEKYPDLAVCFFDVIEKFCNFESMENMF